MRLLKRGHSPIEREIESLYEDALIWSVYSEFQCMTPVCISFTIRSS